MCGSLRRNSPTGWGSVIDVSNLCGGCYRAYTPSSTSIILQQRTSGTLPLQPEPQHLLKYRHHLQRPRLHAPGAISVFPYASPPKHQSPRGGGHVGAFHGILPHIVVLCYLSIFLLHYTSSRFRWNVELSFPAPISLSAFVPGCCILLAKQMNGPDAWFQSTQKPTVSSASQI
jgi:hypothetical protein